MEKIRTIIEETPALLPVQKKFYMVMILERKTKVLDYSMEQLMKLDRQGLEQTENQRQQFTM